MSIWIDKIQEPLVLFGLLGQFIFMLRFVLQWFVSERLGRSHVPIGFWYLSLGGGVMLLIYGIFDHDPVIVLGQSLGLGIYGRNLVLIYRHDASIRRAAGDTPSERAVGPSAGR